MIWGSGATFEDMNTPEYTEGSETGLDRAIAKFDASVDPSEPADSLDGKVKRNEVTVSMAHPTWTPKGAEWTVLYTAPSTWAGSYGGWAGYTRSVPIVLDQAPRRFREALVVPDVEQFPGHIACDSRSKSEICVPFFDKVGKITAVLDIDSDVLGTFDDVDAQELPRILALINEVA